MPLSTTSYFVGTRNPVGCDEQKPVVDSRGKAQMQPVAHGCTLLQLPLQAAKLLLSLRSWRAETVPAHSTAVIMAARNVDLSIFLRMIAPSAMTKLDNARWSFYGLLRRSNWARVSHART
jgi:hypothetical protein